jgi:hypothetical protein
VALPPDNTALTCMKHPNREQRSCSTLTGEHHSQLARAALLFESCALIREQRSCGTLSPEQHRPTSRNSAPNSRAMLSTMLSLQAPLAACRKAPLAACGCGCGLRGQCPDSRALLLRGSSYWRALLLRVLLITGHCSRLARAVRQFESSALESEWVRIHRMSWLLLLPVRCGPG